MQFGFKPSYGTRDAIFAQHFIISNSLCKKKTNEVILCVYRLSISKNYLTLLIDDFQRLPLKESHWKLLKRCIVMLNSVLVLKDF